MQLGLADLVVALHSDVADRPEHAHGVRVVFLAGSERREPEADVADLAVRVEDAHRHLAHVLGFQLAHARPQGVGIGVVVGMHDRVQAARRAQRFERVAEEVGTVEYLARTGVEVEQDDDVG